MMPRFALLLLSILLLGSPTLQDEITLNNQPDSLRKICAQLHVPENHQIKSIYETEAKAPIDNSWASLVTTFTVEEGCLLTLWRSSKLKESPQNFLEGTYQNDQEVLKGSLVAFNCSCVTDKHLHKLEATNFASFRRKHLVRPGTRGNDRFWTNEMRNRRLCCRRFNTFIHATNRQAIQICRGRRVGGGANNLYKSNRRFLITEVRLIRRNPLKYRGRRRSRFVVVACDNNRRPVHLERTESR
ncbi:uncharacterized protein LOC122792378 [Protopterus annectens]|uniref:uncharacterized protein LOC122792378 n=1 Tax=Protopterus annectens TaxID=7888 RepID=UPI001CFA3B35|nr:uncharacterized protein LOC122792378 [Protopterus annectens]